MACPSTTRRSDRSRTPVSPAWGLHYEHLQDGTLYWRGIRSGPDWHAHGVLRTRPRDLKRRCLVRLAVAKQRWKHKNTNETVHSAPPDDLGKRYANGLAQIEFPPDAKGSVDWLFIIYPSDP